MFFLKRFKLIMLDNNTHTIEPIKVNINIQNSYILFILVQITTNISIPQK
jgi:hypothetical protein